MKGFIYVHIYSFIYIYIDIEICFVEVFLAAAGPFFGQKGVPIILGPVLASLRSSRLPLAFFLAKKAFRGFLDLYQLR